MEAVGVPHPEVGCIVGNGFNRRRGDLAGVAVYPVFGWLAGVTNHEGMWGRAGLPSMPTLVPWRASFGSRVSTPTMATRLGLTPPVQQLTPGG